MPCSTPGRYVPTFILALARKQDSSRGARVLDTSRCGLEIFMRGYIVNQVHPLSRYRFMHTRVEVAADAKRAKTCP